MGQGMDVCLADGAECSSTRERLEARFVRCLVCQAGLVLSGSKPAAVFGFRTQIEDPATAPSWMRRLHARRLIACYAHISRKLGVRIDFLGWREERAMLLVWRPRCVQDLLSGTAVQEFLARNLLPAREHAFMRELGRRLRAYYSGRCLFPHEVGLALGYPVEDVSGFMTDGGRGARACGRWKVYGNVDEALRRFKELEREELRIKRLYSEGTPLRGLLRMGTA